MRDDIVKRAGRGVGWNILGQAAEQAIKFVIIVVLTRLLDPGDFGIFAMVLVFTELIRPFREWGFQAALIQKENIDEEYKSTAFWAIAGTGVLLYLFSCLSAPFIGRFFNSPLVGEIIPLMTLAFLVRPFGSVQWALSTRELNFKFINVIDIVGTLFYGATACFLALQGFGVWSFVAAIVVRELSWALMFWFIHGWRPLLKFSFAKFRELLAFAANCTGAGFLSYGINNFDNLMVGKFLGAVPLGYYNLAFNTVSQPETKITSQITNVIFPVYSMIKDDKERVRQAYLKTIKMITLITIPFVSILFVAAKDFVLVFYGSKWLAAVLPIKIMCLYGLMRALTSISSPVFLSQGRPDVELKITILRLAIFIGLVFYGIRHGIVGVAVAVLVYSVINFFPTFYLSNRLMGVGQSKFYAAILRYLIFSLVVIALLSLLNIFYQRYDVGNSLLRLVLSAASGAFVYFAALRISSKSDTDYLMDLIKRVLA